MQRAAKRAGILKKRPNVGKTALTFISEPEAAALATLKRNDERPDVQVSSSIITFSEISANTLQIAGRLLCDL